MELCVKLVIYKDYTKTHSQQNIKFGDIHSRVVSNLNSTGWLFGTYFKASVLSEDN